MEETKKNADFDAALNSLCESISELQKPYYQSDLLPFEAYSSTLSQKIKESVSAYRDSLNKGYTLVLEHIKKNHASELERYRIGPKIEKIVSEDEDLLDVLEEKKVLQAVFQYDGKMMRQIYEFADSLFEEKKFAEAADVFLFLISLNPYICWFWQGLGKSFQAQNKIEEATNAFLIAINCDPLRLQGYSDVIKCSLEFKNFETIDKIIEYGLDIAKNSEAQEKVKELKEGLNAVKVYCDRLKMEAQS